MLKKLTILLKKFYPKMKSKKILNLIQKTLKVILFPMNRRKSMSARKIPTVM